MILFILGANGTNHTSSDDEMHKVGRKIIKLGVILAHRKATIIKKGKTYTYLSSIIPSTKIIEDLR
jgi:hypothetical protein